MKQKIIYLLLLLITMNPIFIQAQNDIKYYMLANAKIKLQQTDSALYFINLAIEKNTNILNIETRASIYLSKRLISDAIIDYNNMNQLKAGSGNYGLSRCYALRGIPLESIKYLKLHLESENKLPQKIIKQDSAFKLIEYSIEWRNLWAIEWYNKTEYIYSEIEYLIGNENYIEAINSCTEFLNKHQKAHKMYFYRAKVYFLMNQSQNSLDDINKALLIKKNYYEYSKLRLEILSNLGKNKDIVNSIESIIADNPVDFELYKIQYWAYFQLSEYNESKRLAKEMLIYFPADTILTRHISLCCYKEANYLEALEFINKNLAKSPLFIADLEIRADCYAKVKLIIPSIRDYSQILDLNPNQLDIWYKRGTVKLMDNDKSGACKDWNHAMKRGHRDSYNAYTSNCN